MITTISPIAKKISKFEKASLLKQRGAVIWMIGLPGSGKTTLARALEEHLHYQGFLTQLLDNDRLRKGINNNLGFSEPDQKESLRRSAEIARLFVECGVITICSFVSPTVKIRKMTKDIIGDNNFYEIYVNCSQEECERRDAEDMYSKTYTGVMPEFTDIASIFEEPKDVFLEIDTDEKDMEECVSDMISAIEKKIKFYLL